MHRGGIYLDSKPQPDLSASAFVSWLACSRLSQRFQASSQKQKHKHLVQILLNGRPEKPNNPPESVNNDMLLWSDQRTGSGK